MPSIGTRRHRVTLDEPTGAPVPDGDGGSTQDYAALVPARVWARLEPATAAKLERIASGTVLATATHILTLRFHPGVTTKTRITKGPRAADGSLAPGSREFHVTGVATPEELEIDTVAICAEVVS